MREVCKTVYNYSELSEKAQEKARDWYRGGAFDYEWWDYTVEEFVTIGNMLGITFDGEGTRNLRVHFSGFWSQGDGASFAGSWEYKANALCEVKREFPHNRELHDIAEALHQIAVRYEQSEGCDEDYPLSALIYISPSRYCNENTMRCTSDSEDLDEDLLEQFRSLAQWLYSRLENQWEDMNSDEVVAESIECNEYEFNEDGTIA